MTALIRSFRPCDPFTVRWRCPSFESTAPVIMGRSTVHLDRRNDARNESRLAPSRFEHPVSAFATVGKPSTRRDQWYTHRSRCRWPRTFLYPRDEVEEEC